MYTFLETHHMNHFNTTKHIYLHLALHLSLFLSLSFPLSPSTCSYGICWDLFVYFCLIKSLVQTNTNSKESPDNICYELAL